MGGEDVADMLVRGGGDVYVAYDPDARQCRGTDISSATSRGAISVAICRVPALVLVQNASSVLGPLNPDYVCGAPPLVPAGLRVVSNGGGIVTIAWSESATKRASYMLEVGRAPGQSGALAASLGRVTSFTAYNVRAGAYFVRIRGRNACGAGAASNELVVQVE
jgi:hypothetical protein